jgi:hypothetical protein
LSEVAQKTIVELSTAMEA